MSKEFLYLNDSGDAGLQNSTTDQLIIAAVIIVDESEKDAIGEAIDNFRFDLGWHESDAVTYLNLLKNKIEKIEKITL
jgi:hypothetical protein